MRLRRILFETLSVMKMNLIASSNLPVEREEAHYG